VIALKDNQHQRLKSLINICKQTNNYKKLADTAYQLLNIQADLIGFKLGFNIRDSSIYEDSKAKKNENDKRSSLLKLFPKNNTEQKSIHEYLKHISTILSNSLDIELFKPEILNRVKKAELLYQKSKGLLQLEHISMIFESYFELKKIELPDFHKKVGRDKIHSIADFRIYSLFSENPANGRKNIPQSNGGIKQLMAFQLQKKEDHLKAQLEENYEPELLEDLLLLKQLKKSLKQNHGKRIQLQGSLAESISYQKSFTSLYGYFIVGLFVIFLCFGINMIALLFIQPLLLGALAMFILIIMGMALFFLYIYWSNFKSKMQ
jgi:hypothetical protein